MMAATFRVFALLVICCVFLEKTVAQAPVFIEYTANTLPGIEKGSANFADIDDDGDVDLLLNGISTANGQMCQLFENNGGGLFSELTNNTFNGAHQSRAAFGDHNGDGHPDLILSGTIAPVGLSSTLYSNNGAGIFTETLDSTFAGVTYSAIAFDDVDNDGDPDLLITGFEVPDLVSKLYLNEGNAVFTEVQNTPFLPVFRGAVAMADVDGDADLDIVISGRTSTTTTASETKLYINNGPQGFAEVTTAILTGVGDGAVAFADVDDDDDLDLFLTGRQQNGFVSSELYINDGQGGFTVPGAQPFVNVGESAVAFVDVDNDDDPDIILSGSTGPSRSIKLYLNDGNGTYIEVANMPFVAVTFPSIACADIDGDLDQDIIVTGTEAIGQTNARVFLNCLHSKWFVDSDEDGYGDLTVDSITCIRPMGYAADSTDCDDSDILAYPGAPCDDALDYTFNDAMDSNCTCAGELGQVDLKVFLEGPYDPNTGLMHDSLRVQGLIPLTEPYTGLGYAFDQNAASGTVLAASGTTIDPAVLAVSGPNAIVDWVVVELRDKDIPQENSGGILKSRVALLQRDGDVVDLDGVSPIAFSIEQEAYHIAVEHRNHLPAMTDQASLNFGTTGFGADMTMVSQAMFNNIPSRNNVNGVMVQATGDVTYTDQTIQYTGAGNDRDQVLLKIGGSVPTNVVNGYFQEDGTMDGQVKYTGSGNDRDPILQNIGGSVPTNQRSAPLP